MGGAFTVANKQNLPPFPEYFTWKELCITFWCGIINWCKWGNAEKISDHCQSTSITAHSPHR
jgi:hypothetical protein